MYSIAVKARMPLATRSGKKQYLFLFRQERKRDIPKTIKMSAALKATGTQSGKMLASIKLLLHQPQMTAKPNKIEKIPDIPGMHLKNGLNLLM